MNNPADTPVTATLRKAMDLPGLRFDEAKLTLVAGEYKVLVHDGGTP